MMSEARDEVLLREKRYWEAKTTFEWLSERGIRTVLERIPEINGDVLEMCSGSGMFTRHVPKRYNSYTCMDLSQTLLDELALRIPDVQIVQGNAEEPEFEENTFDLILIFAGLHHLPNLERAIVASERMLKPGGSFIAFEPNAKCWYRKPMLPLKKLLKLYTDDERFLEPQQVHQTMDECGFRKTRIDYVTPEYNPEHLASSLNRLLAKFIYIAAKMSPGVRWQTFFVIQGIKE
jgi:ubiquinone/menaquinone biosynthesis C-methylase UbiE